MANEEIKIVINADDRASGVLNKLSGTAGGLSTVLKGVGAVAGIAAVAGFGALAAGAVSSVRAFSETQEAVAQLDAVLKSTKGAVGLFKEDLLDQAAALQKVTKYSDEAVIGAQSLLLTFTQVKGPVFQEAIGTILDMSTALGQDLKSSAIQVGKALNDPIEGVNALRRVGVSFTEEQQKQIQTMVQSGQVMQAQRFILAELATEFGGSAQAAAETFTGKLEILKNQLGEFQEVIGKALIDGVTPLVTKLTELAQQESVQQAIVTVAGALSQFIIVIFAAISAVVEFGKAGVDLAQGILAKLKPTFDLLWIVIQEQVLPALRELWNQIINELWPAIVQLWNSLQPLMPLLIEFGKLIGITIVAAIIIAIKILIELATEIVKITTFFLEVANVITNVVVKAWDRLLNTLADIINAFKTIIEFAGKAISAVSSVGGKVGSSISSSLGISGKRALGGNVNASRTYLVGEEGPELFTPSQSGRITPNSQLVSGSGIVINITGTFLSKDAAVQITDMVADQLKLQLRI